MSMLIDKIENLIDWVGRCTAWLSLVVVMFTLIAVVLRYFFGFNTAFYQEVALYAHASLFMLGSAWALQKGEHVRVDVLYSRFSPKRKALVNAIGCLIFLLPSMVFIIWMSWDYVASSIRILEVSQESQGLPLVYCLKALMPIGAALLMLTGISYGYRQVAFLLNPNPSEGEAQL